MRFSSSRSDSQPWSGQMTASRRPSSFKSFARLKTCVETPAKSTAEGKSRIFIGRRAGGGAVDQVGEGLASIPEEKPQHTGVPQIEAGLPHVESRLHRDLGTRSRDKRFSQPVDGQAT